MPEAIAAANHPEFGWSVLARIADQLILNVKADAKISAFMEEVLAVELEELLIDDNWHAPLLVQTIPGSLRVPDGSSRQGRLTGEIEWIFIWGDEARGSARGTRQRLKERIVEHFCQVLEQDRGVVTEADTGAQLTLGLLGIRRIPRPVLIPAAVNTLATRVVTVHNACIHLETGELYDV